MTVHWLEVFDEDNGWQQVFSRASIDQAKDGVE